MTLADVIARQRQERKDCLEAILGSKAKRKLIVAGAGTGVPKASISVLQRFGVATLRHIRTL